MVGLEGQLNLMGAVRVHHEDVVGEEVVFTTGSTARERDLGAVGGPVRVGVVCASERVGEVDQLGAIRVHGVDVVVAVRGAGEGDLFVGRGLLRRGGFRGENEDAG